MGWFNVNLPAEQAQEIVTMEGYNPLVTVVNAVPSNIINAMSTNTTILSVVVIAIVLGLCITRMGEKANPIKSVIQNLNDIVGMFLDFLINKIAPIIILLYLLNHPPVTADILRQPPAIRLVKKLCRRFPRQFPRQTEDIPHINRASVNATLIDFNLDKLCKTGAKRLGNSDAKLQPDNC